MLCVGSIRKNKVKLVLMDGAALSDPLSLVNAELEGSKRRGIDFFESVDTDAGALRDLIRAAISHNRTLAKKKARSQRRRPVASSRYASRAGVAWREIRLTLSGAAVVAV